MPIPDSFIKPDWNAPSNIKACVTTRSGGFSKPPYDSFNLATHVGDDLAVVQKNRAWLKQTLNLPAEPLWLEQIHGVEVADQACDMNCQADAFYTNQVRVVGVVMTADCLPVFITNEQGTEIAIAHAGWRGLLDGVVEASLDKFKSDRQKLMVWLGPAIGPEHFEVGEEVRRAYLAREPELSNKISKAFKPAEDNKWMADIYALARVILEKAGVKRVTGGEWCTVSDVDRFFSYRRDGVTGRMASLIWIE